MPCGDVDAMAYFYVRTLGMEKVTFGDGRLALYFGGQKINLLAAGGYAGLHTLNHLAGTQDICLISTIAVAEIKRELGARGIDIVEGPVERHRCRQYLERNLLP
jgi:catechol 2,3-dioxygenase-like lactoylglutathione lyase family enzyme